MSVTVTFEKKHFLMMGLIIAIPFLILAIANIIATNPAPTGQYHSASELWVNQDIEMNNFKLNNSGNISITGSENGIIFPDGTVQKSASASSVFSSDLCIIRKPPLTNCPSGWHIQNYDPGMISALDDWVGTVINGGSPAEKGYYSWAGNSANLQVYKCSNSKIYTTYTPESDVLYFEWSRSTSKTYGEIAGLKLSKVSDGSIITDTLSTSPMYISVPIGEQLKLEFSITQSPSCFDGTDHAYTYFTIDNIGGIMPTEKEVFKNGGLRCCKN